MDPELQRKLTARRSLVESEGTSWETHPDESCANVHSQWVLVGYQAEDCKLVSIVDDLDVSFEGGSVHTSAPAHDPADNGEAVLVEETRMSLAYDLVDDANSGGQDTESRDSSKQPFQNIGSDAPKNSQDQPTTKELQHMLAHLRASSREEGRCFLRSLPEATRHALAKMVADARSNNPTLKIDSGSSLSRTAGQQCAEEQQSAQKMKDGKLAEEEAARCAATWPSLLLHSASEQTGAQLATASLSVDSLELGDDIEVSKADRSTIAADIVRTRADDLAFRRQGMRVKVESLIKRFCHNEQLRYLQGLHEVAAVFAFLQTVQVAEGNAVLDDATVLACLIAFTRRFAPFFHDGEAFVALHVSLLFFRQLLMYHHPDLHNLLNETGVPPLAYAAPWYITLFAARTPLLVILQLWDRYLTRNDSGFLPFLAVATIAKEKAAILAAGRDGAHNRVCRAGIFSVEELNVVWQAAVDLRAQTPASFSLRLGRALGAVLEKCSSSASDEKPWSDRVLERLDKERLFMVLAGEIAAAASSQFAGLAPVMSPTQASSSNKAVSMPRLRFLILDVRLSIESEAEHVPQALIFNPPSLRRFVSAARSDAQPRFQRFAAALPALIGGLISNTPSGSGGSSSGFGGSNVVYEDDESVGTFTPATLVAFNAMFEELKLAAAAEWGEDWLCESAGTHLVLLGGDADAGELNTGSSAHGIGAVVPLYEAFTDHLALSHVSVVLGGAAALHRVLEKRGLHTQRLVSSTSPEGKRSSSSLLGSAWSRLQAASEALPAAEVVSGRWEGFLHTGAGAARSIAGNVAGGAAAVRQHAAPAFSKAAERVAAARQQAS